MCYSDARTWLFFIFNFVGHVIGNDEMVTMDGSQFIVYKLNSNSINQDRNKLGFIFQTTQSSGLLFYASGLSGDYIALELYHGAIRYMANSDGLYSNTSIQLIHIGNFADGKFHQVNIEIGKYTKLYTYSYPAGKSADTVALSKANDLEFDLDEVMYFMGKPDNERQASYNVLLSNRNFQGCLNVITFNDIEISFPTIESKYKDFHFIGNFTTGCIPSQPFHFHAITYLNNSIEIYLPINSTIFKLEFQLKTYVQSGVIFTYIAENKKYPYILLIVIENEYRLSVNLSSKISFQILQSDAYNNDGTWRSIEIIINESFAALIMDKNKVEYRFGKKTEINFPSLLKFGGNFPLHDTLLAFYKNIKIGNLAITKYKTVFNINREIDELPDICFPKNPCKNDGRCSQYTNSIRCDCASTRFIGTLCEKPKVKYHSSCEDYFRTGYRADGSYIIQPGLSRPFTVKCLMKTPDGSVKTVIDTTSPNKTYVFTGSNLDADYFYHKIFYIANMKQIQELIHTSKKCKQYIGYNCYESTLLNSNDKKEQHSQIGLRWFNWKGELKTSWGSASNESCRCAIKNNCAKNQMKCNCDAMDKKLRYDDGYITDKIELPVSKFRVSVVNSNHRSSIVIGPLECSGSLSSSDKRTIEIPKADQIPSLNDVTIINSDKIPDLFKKRNNDTSINQKENNTVIVIDTKFLYLIIVLVVIIFAIIVVSILKKRCCSLGYGKALPHIVEIYKDEPFSNKIEINNDITLNLDRVDIPLKASPEHRAPPTYSQTSSSSSTNSCSEPMRFYDQEEDSYSLNDDHVFIPKRSILKIKKNDIHKVRSSSHSPLNDSFKSDSENYTSSNCRKKQIFIDEDDNDLYSHTIRGRCNEKELPLKRELKNTQFIKKSHVTDVLYQYEEHCVKTLV